MTVIREVTPDPEAWLRCTVCGTAYVLRRALLWSGEYIWIWQPDCKHRKAPPAITTKEGPATLTQEELD